MEGISITGISAISAVVPQVTDRPGVPPAVAGRKETPFFRNADGDTVTLSPESQNLSRQSRPQPTEEGINPSTPPQESSLSAEELRQLSQLKKRDTEVRAHEQAHLSAAGSYAASGASFTYQQGPDGARYAVGGEVNIDISKENSPEATIEKMQTIRRAALAPASPSPADRQIAAQASVTEAQARQELMLENQKSENSTSPEPATRSSASGNEQSSASANEVGSDRTTRAMIDTYTGISALA